MEILFINSCSPFASDIAAQIPVNLLIEVIPFAVNPVLPSTRDRVAMFAETLKWDKKSAPRIGVFTWAIVKIHGKDRRKPKLSVSAISP